MIRATTIGVLKNYRYGLNKSFTKLNNARETYMSHRNFNSFAEDPSAAALTFQLRRARMTVESQITVCSTASSKFQSAWASLDRVVKDVDNVCANSCKQSDLKALNEATAGASESRSALGKQLNELADTILQVMNNKYADNFLFSGADGQTVPFTWGENGEVLYRGIPVDACVPEVQTDSKGNNVTITLDAEGKYDPNGTPSHLVAGKSAMVEYDPAAPVPENAVKNSDDQAILVKEDGTFLADMDEVNEVLDGGGKVYFVTADKDGTISKKDYDKQASDVAKLEYLANDEKLYQDIGLGNEEDENGKRIASSVFDATLQGINFLGWGKDADGDPKNIISLIKQCAEICNSGEGRLSDEEYNKLFRLVGKTEDASQNLQNAHVAMDARRSKLESNLNLLVENYDTLREQYSEIEDVDDADAISAFIWAQYSYNAALRVGNSVLAQSLMDYMN